MKSGSTPHLFVNISSHGLGHLAQAAPVLNALAAIRPLALTIRSGLTQEQLARRIHAPFKHIHCASDFGFVMHDALRIDLPASAARYQAEYADWADKVAADARLFRELKIALVLSDISPLPLAGAKLAGIPAVAMCSLNWAELFEHYFGRETWARPISDALHEAYAGAQNFLRFTPGMPMPGLANVTPIGPISTPAGMSRAQAARALGLPENKRWLLFALGGIAHRLPVEDWPAMPDVQFLLPQAWQTQQLDARQDISYFSDQRFPFAELLPQVDAVLTKPGYGTVAESTCNGVPVLYLRRPDWPEEAYLLEWLHAHNRAIELSPEAAVTGDVQDVLKALWQQPIPPRPLATGMDDAARLLAEALGGC